MLALQQRVEDNAFHLRFVWQRLANEIPNKPADDNVFAQLRNLTSKQIFDSHVGIFDEGLFKQTDGAVEFLEFSFDNLFSNVVRFALDLGLVNLALDFDQVTANICATNIERMCCGDMQRDVFHELAEILVPSHKIGLAIHLYEDADLALQMNIGGHDALLRCACGLLASAGDAFGPQNRLRFG